MNKQQPHRDNQHKSSSRMNIRCRPSQYNYTKQIFNQYVKDCSQQLAQRMFKTLHSDWLNLTLSYLNLQKSNIQHQHHRNSSTQSPPKSQQKNTQNIQILRSQSHYNKRDILMEIRGSIINKQKLQMLAKQNLSIANFVSKTTCLLWGESSSRTQVLVPKGISTQLLKNDSCYMQFLQRNQSKSNCFIQFQPGPKYLVQAQTEIHPGDALILNLKSLQKHIYNPRQQNAFHNK